MSGTLRLGKFYGIDVNLHISWFLIFLLLTLSLAINWFPQLFAGWSTGTYWITAVIAVLLLFVGVLLHEIAHALIARAHGLTVKGITLFIFGGVAEIDQNAQRPGTEFQIAIAGPIVSGLIAGVAFLLEFPLRGSGTPMVALLNYLAITNLLLGVFNLIPGFPLDGGRVLRALLWKLTGDVRRATRFASIAGQGCGYLFMLLGVALFFMGNFFSGLWLIFIGWFLLHAARAAKEQVTVEANLQGIAVRQVMQPSTGVPANISLLKLVNEYFLPQGMRAAPVLQGEYLVGLITLREIARIERDRWASTPVGYVMRLVDQIYVASPEHLLYEVLQEMVKRDINQVPVTQEGRLVGLISRESILRYLHVCTSLQDEQQPDAVHQLK